MIGEILIALVIVFIVLSIGVYFTWTTVDDGEMVDIVCIILYWLLIIGIVCIVLGI